MTAVSLGNAVKVSLCPSGCCDKDNACSGIDTTETYNSWINLHTLFHHRVVNSNSVHMQWLPFHYNVR